MSERIDQFCENLRTRLNTIDDNMHALNAKLDTETVKAEADARAHLADLQRRAAAYVDRILRGEKPANLPMQAPTKYELGDQPQDCENAWPRSAANPARPRR